MNRRALAIGVGAALVLTVLWYFLLWSPRSDDLDEAKERRQTALAQQNQLRTEIARLRAAQRDEPLLRARLETLRTSIPDEPNLAQFILDANDAAISSGIDFISIAPSLPAAGGTASPGAPAAGATTTVPAGQATPAAAPAEIRLALQIRGGYFQVLDFLNRLDALPRLVVTDGLNVTSEATASPRLTVAVTARMFLRAVPASFGGTAATTTAPGATPPTTVAGAPTPTAPGGATTTTAPGATTTTIAGAGA